MSRERRITVTLPDGLLRQVDGIVAGRQGSRSQIIQEAMEYYLNARRESLYKNLRAGYQQMAEINLSLAEEGLPADNEAFALPPGSRWEAR